MCVAELKFSAESCQRRSALEGNRLHTQHPLLGDKQVGLSATACTF